MRELSIAAIWEEATPAERRILIEDLIDGVLVYPDHLQVKVSGAPPLNVTLAEVGLKDPGTKRSVSEGGLNPKVHCGSERSWCSRDAGSIMPRITDDGLTGPSREYRSASAVARYRRWGLSIDQADRLAVRAGLHPCEVWGFEWTAAGDELEVA
jgi:hypothetical protein